MPRGPASRCGERRSWTTRWPCGAVSRWPSSATRRSRGRRSRASRSSTSRWWRSGQRRSSRSVPTRRSSSELEALVHANPLRERLRAQLMLALYRSGRQAQALESYSEGRDLLVEELGLEPSPLLRGVHASILRQETFAAGRGAIPEVEHFEEVAAALLAGKVTVVVGSDSEPLASELARRFGVEAVTPELARVSQAVAVLNGAGPLYDTLHTLVESDGEPSAVHRFLARLPALLRERETAQPLLVTTGYELALERALEEVEEQYETVCYLAAGQMRGSFCHIAPTGVASVDRAAERVHRRARARRAHGAPPSPGTSRPLQRARVGELRRHRGRLHPLRRRRAAAARLARRAPAPHASAPARLHPLDLDAARRPRPFLGQRAAAVPLVVGAPGTGAARAGVLAEARRRGRGHGSGGLRRRARARDGEGACEQPPGEPIQGPRSIRRLGARRAPLLRSRARDRRRGGERAREPAHRPLRTERGWQELAARRRGRAPAARAERRARSSSTTHGRRIPPVA